jgi:hypothetical protein
MYRNIVTGQEFPTHDKFRLHVQAELAVAKHHLMRVLAGEIPATKQVMQEIDASVERCMVVLDQIDPTTAGERV